MDKSKGEPVISLKTKSKERVSKQKILLTEVAPQYRRAAFYMPAFEDPVRRSFVVSFLQSSKSRDRSSLSKEKKEILTFDQIKEQRERERQRQREREVREVERRRFA